MLAYPQEGSYRVASLAWPFEDLPDWLLGSCFLSLLHEGCKSSTPVNTWCRPSPSSCAQVCEVVPNCGLDLHFSDANHGEHISFADWPFIHFPGETPIPIPSPLLNWVICVFIVRLSEVRSGSAYLPSFPWTLHPCKCVPGPQGCLEAPGVSSLLWAGEASTAPGKARTAGRGAQCARMDGQAMLYH